jgi:Flp pilus assembly pilin Flp
METLYNRWLLAEVAIVERLRSAGRRLDREIDRVAKGETGQTPTEYLMIVGLMAAVIVLVFVTFYWQQVKTAAQSWVAKVSSAILGSNIQ